MTSGITVDPVPASDEHEETPVKKVTITNRDDAYLAALLGDKVAEISIDKHDLEFDIVFEGDNIFGFTPPMPTSTREWLLLALATKLQNVGNVGGKEPGVLAPNTLENNADLAAVINKVNAIISALTEAGVFS